VPAYLKNSGGNHVLLLTTTIESRDYSVRLATTSRNYALQLATH
jgi:hypothetical protein